MQYDRDWRMRKIANAELKALLAENRNLRLMTLSGLGSSPGGSTSMDLNAFDAQQQISELRDSYSVSVKTLEVTDKNDYVKWNLCEVCRPRIVQDGGEVVQIIG
ncbi:hypothetical protein LSAT2_011684 [Lamellibrachia satsuma]|nr:hypothetical protein LSAT2_011684 [Lamellibrachia satsuma]